MPNTKEIELWRLVNKAFQNSIEKFGDIFAKDVTRDLLDNGVTVQKWISVKERLPQPKENPVLVPYAGCVWMAWKHDNYWELAGGLNTTCVTHWMPLPQPPKGE